MRGRDLTCGHEGGKYELAGAEVRALFEAVLPDAQIAALAEELGVVERQRKLDVVTFTRAAVISANTPSGGMPPVSGKMSPRLTGRAEHPMGGECRRLKCRTQTHSKRRW